jgi:hypothetical protein
MLSDRERGEAMKEWKKFLYIAAAFLACFYLPVENMLLPMRYSKRWLW